MHQVGRTGLAADHSPAAGIAGRRNHAAAGRTAGWGRDTAGAVQLVGRESGRGWRRNPGRTDPVERHSCAAG